MTNPLKELLDRLGMDIGSAEVAHVGCTVENTITLLQTRIADIPTKDSPDSEVLSYALNIIRTGGKSLIKDARKKELELELRMLDKPDEVDLSSDEYQHMAKHLEEDQLQAEFGKREGQALLRFCDLIESRFGEVAKSSHGETLN